MPSSVLAAKLAPPRLSPDHLHRERLDRRWQELLARRLLFVVAGAGFGKTSFLADWAGRESRPVGWYTLDDSDVDPGVFLDHLSQMVAETVGWSTPGSGLSTDLNAIVQLLFASERPPVLVFDDVHTVRPGSGTFEHLARVVRYLPPGGCVVLASREPPAIDRARWEVQGQVGELTAAELAFDEEEISALFARRLPGFPIESDLLRRVAEQTEGWAAGLELLLQRLDGPRREEIDEILSTMSSVGSGWFAYFAEEVVGRLGPDLQRFLQLSAFLPRLVPGICDEVLGIDRSAAYLEELHVRNLFTFGTQERGAVYRYHPLFRTYLQTTALQRESADSIRSLRKRAARVLLRAGQVSEALSELVAVGDVPGALGIVRKRAVALFESGRLDGVSSALGRIPGPELGRCPEALALLGASRDYEGQWTRAASLYRKALAAGPRPVIRAEILARMASLEQRRGRNRAAIRLCRQGLDGVTRMSPPVRARLLSTEGIACCDCGKIAEGEIHLTEALKLAERSGETQVSARVLFLLAANVHYPRGDFVKAREAARRSHLLFQELERSLQICHSLGVLAFVMMEGGDLEGARPLARRALRIAHSLEYESIAGYCEYTVGKIAALSGDSGGARASFERAIARGERTGEAHLLVLPQLGMASLDLAAGNLPRARIRTQGAIRAAESVQDRLGQIQALHLLGRIELSADPAGARRCWERAATLAERLGAWAEFHRIGLDLVAEGGETIRLLRLMRGIAECEHEFLLAELPPERVRQLCAGARRAGMDAGYLEDLERRFLGPIVDPFHTGASGPSLEIRALGPLRVGIGSRWIERSDWRSGRARRLFLALLSHRFRWIPKERLIELLWPESDPERGENSLRQSIHVLRRLLEPDALKGVSAYVLVQGDACRLDPGQNVVYDVAEFEREVAEGERIWDVDDPASAEPCFRRAVELWRGNLVEDSPYEDLLASERERVRELFVRSVLRTIEACVDRGEWAEAVIQARRGLHLDPYQEDLHAFLIEGLAQIGHRKEAIEAYQEYEARMVGEMKLLPSRRITALAERAGALSRRPAPGAGPG